MTKSTVTGMDIKEFMTRDPQPGEVAISMIGWLDGVSRKQRQKLYQKQDEYDDVLFIDVDDIESFEKFMNYPHRFTIMQPTKADKIIKFLDKYKNDHHLVVHCIFGVSRTGAVVETAKLMGYQETYDRAYNPNLLMKTQLTQAIRKLRKEQ